MATFKNAVKSTKAKTARTTTTNGMAAYVSTGDKVLNFFGQVGSARGRDMTDAFNSALAENEELAIRALLWSRDVRGGAGERQIFRDQIAAVEKKNPKLAAEFMHMVPVVGRWDDLFAYKDKENRVMAFNLIGRALSDNNALCAKWMPRTGPVFNELWKHFGFTPKVLRKVLVKTTNVVETKMCRKEWDTINFSQVPSLAHSRYSKAFTRNSKDAYAKYLAELQKPENERSPDVKINAGAVYPYDVTKMAGRGNASAADAQWEALPNYMNGTAVLPMVDVSGSMTTRATSDLSCLDIAVSLGLYCSMKTRSEAFKDLFLTFSYKPQFVTTKGTLSERIKKMSRADWQMNTNISAAFDAILNTAIKGKVAQKDMPEVLLILSDMQFDYATRGGYYRDSDAWNSTAQETLAAKYRAAGYELPRVVYWNLAKTTANSPVTFDDVGTAIVSGFSPSVMQAVLSNDLETYTPYNVMLKAIGIDRYDYKKQSVR